MPGRAPAEALRRASCTPWRGLDHLLAMMAVGLWGAVLGRPLIYALPTVFPLMMAGGGLLGLLAVPVPPVEMAWRYGCSCSA